MDHNTPIAAELPFDEVEQPASAPRPIASRPTRETMPPAPLCTPASPRRRFAGLTYGQLVLAAVLVLAAIWAMWATSRIFALDDRRVVSVRLAGIVNDFVTAEAKSGTPPEQLAPRTRAFMMALDAVLKKRAASGQVVLVGEAVVASSVPDVTADIVADLAKLVKMPVAAALPPAISAPMPSPRSVPSLTQIPAGASASPFEPAATVDGTGTPEADPGPQQ